MAVSSQQTRDAIALPLELALVEGSVKASPIQELIVSTGLDQAPTVDHEDAVGGQDRG
jgi:hypothetical protein